MTDVEKTPVPFGLMRLDKAVSENDAIDLVRRAINMQWFRRRKGVSKLSESEFLHAFLPVLEDVLERGLEGREPSARLATLL